MKEGPIAMELQRGGHREQRRRRVLLDEARADVADDPRDFEPVEVAADRKGGLYAAAAADPQQPPVTALIPRRAGTLLAGFLLGLTMIAGVECLYLCVFQACDPPRRHVLVALDVAARGSLAAWSGGAMLLLAAAVALMILQLRRHKLDDYRGRYRIWAWGAPALAAASLDAATGLHPALLDGLATVLRTVPYHDLGLPLVLAMAAAYVAARLLRETWRCRSASALLLLALAAYGACLVARTEWLRIEPPTLQAAALSTCLLAAHFLLLSGLVLYCRFVYREAQGAEPAKAGGAGKTRDDKKARGEAQTASGDSADMPRVEGRPNIRLDPAHQDPRVSAPTPPPATPTTPPRPQGAVSKAERRRLRKQQRLRDDE